jgi:phosphoglycolate phosphatase
MRLVVFDCDGTLVDSQQAIVASTEAALATYGLGAPSRTAILHAVGLPVDVAMRLHAPDVDDETLAKVIDVFRDSYQKLSQQDDRGQVMFDGLHDLICQLGEQDQLAMAIVTMKSRRGLGRVVDAYNIRSYFQSLKSADDGPGKPAPDLLLDAMRECDVSAEQTVMVGDTSFDMLMAKAAGAHAVGVAWGYQDIDELEEAGADEIANSPEQLQRILANFLAGE